MSLKDTLEIGLKPDAPYRKDNLPEFQQSDPDCVDAAEPGDGPRQQAARERCTTPTAEKTRARRAAEEDDIAEARFTAEGGANNETR